MQGKEKKRKNKRKIFQQNDQEKPSKLTESLEDRTGWRSSDQQCLSIMAGNVVFQH